MLKFNINMAMVLNYILKEGGGEGVLNTQHSKTTITSIGFFQHGRCLFTSNIKGLICYMDNQNRLTLIL